MKSRASLLYSCTLFSHLNGTHGSHYTPIISILFCHGTVSTHRRRKGRHCVHAIVTLSERRFFCLSYWRLKRALGRVLWEPKQGWRYIVSMERLFRLRRANRALYMARDYIYAVGFSSLSITGRQWWSIHAFLRITQMLIYLVAVMSSILSFQDGVSHFGNVETDKLR
jgi:hypothetical protein